MKKLLFISIAFLFIFTGCATAYKMNDISLGMTKQEVIHILGRPNSTSAISGVEYLSYTLTEPCPHGLGGCYGPARLYFVRIINGRVDAYGLKGDFDSTKTPVTRSNIDLNINK